MGEQASAPGHFMIPTAPAPGVACVQSAVANTFGTLTQLIASTAAALLITGIYVEVIAAANLPTYVAVELAVVASTIVDMAVVPLGPTTGVAATQWGTYKPINPPIPVANATKILAATASSVASAISYLITLECVAVTNMVDDGVNESSNIKQWLGAAVLADAANLPKVDVEDWKGGVVPAVSVTGVPKVDLADWLGAAPAALAGGMVQSGAIITAGTAAAGAAGTITLAGTSAVDSFYNDTLIYLIGGTGAGQARLITGYVGSTKVATITPAWVTTPDATSVYAVLAAGRADLAAWLGTIPTTNVAGVPKVDLVDWLGTAPLALTAQYVQAAPFMVAANTASAGAGSTITLVGASAVDGFYVGQMIVITGGTGAGQSRIITAYVGATKIATISPAWITNPDATSVYIVTAEAGALLTSGQLSIKKNTALSAFMFLMVLASDHNTPATGLTVTAQRAIDGGAFATATNSATIAEIASGWYSINLSAADLNGTNIALRFTAATADACNLEITTQA